jgi:signal transduction histidine kinase
VLTAIAVQQLLRERALVRLRTEFVASVSHELRTPLTQIRMFAETLLMGRVRSDEERTHALAVIDRESRRLAQLVDNILQFSRGERGHLRLTRERRDVAALLRESVDAFAPLAKARGMKIAVDAPATLVAEIDADAMRQIVLNLLDNAAKYGPDGQTIVVTLEAGLRLTVEDEGPGIPERDRERVWQRYVRLEREEERAIAGAGIGLAVVRDLVRLHGGTARVEQGSRGARFVVEVPA